MTHRNGSGQRLDDIEAARAIWIAQERTVSTYTSKAEYDALVEDFGQLVETFPDGKEVRQHAIIKDCRGGARKIVHNCVIVGNPTVYAKWAADPRPVSKKGWCAEWTFYPHSYLTRVLDWAREV